MACSPRTHAPFCSSAPSSVRVVVTCSYSTWPCRTFSSFWRQRISVAFIGSLQACDLDHTSRWVLD
eukprot:1184811-Prorocentrum_minimum.AAC.2